MRDVGDRIAIRHEVRDPDGVPTSATVTVQVTKPDGTPLSPNPTVTETSVGNYDASFVADVAGVWRFKWTTSGAVEDVEYGSVDVADVPPGTYATLAQLRRRVNITTGDRDVDLREKLSAAARAFDRDCGRRPGGFELARTTSPRTYSTRGRIVWTRDGEKLLVDEIGSATGLTVEVGDRSTWTAVTDYETKPDNALADYQPITALLRTNSTWGCEKVRITAHFGWPAVPDDAVEAVLIAAHRLYRRKDSPEGVTGGGDMGPVRLSRIDPDYRRIVESLTLPGFA